MANMVFTVAKGCFIEKAKLPLGTDNLLLVLLKNTPLPADNTLRNYTTLAQVLANTAEADFTNYARKVLSSGSITIGTNNTTFLQTLTLTNTTWTAAGGVVNNTFGKIIVCYRPASSSLDSAIMPLFHADFTGGTASGDMPTTFAAPLAQAT